MFRSHSKLLIITFAYLLVCPALSLATDSVAHDSAANNSYRLVTLPSANKEDVEGMLGVVQSEIPKATVKKTTEKKLFYRLVAGKFNDMAAAVRLRSELLQQKIPSFIMQSKNRFKVIVSSHLSEQLALDEQRQLANRHIKTSIVTFYNSLSYWQISSVDSFELRDAVYTASLMTMRDVITTIE